MGWVRLKMGDVRVSGNGEAVRVFSDERRLSILCCEMIIMGECSSR
jgi:hypothetical protein